MKPLTIGFEWLHRAWKGTQMKLLKDYLNNRLMEVISVRGEYYRKWDWSSDFFDPYSKWRQMNWNNDSINFEKSQRINREIKILFDRTLLYLNKQLAILFDRTIVSRCFLDSLSKKEVSFNDVKYIYTKSWKLIEKIIPDIIFILQCDKQVLLDRLSINELSEDNLIYKQNFINKYNNKFNEYVTKELPSELKTKVIIIDGSSTPQDTHKEITKHLNAYIR